MYAPNVNKSEAIRLINEMAKCDCWAMITCNYEEKSIELHAENIEDAESVIIGYILASDSLKDKLITALKDKYEI